MALEKSLKNDIISRQFIRKIGENMYFILLLVLFNIECPINGMFVKETPTDLLYRLLDFHNTPLLKEDFMCTGVKDLLKKGAKVNADEPYYDTPLHAAARAGASSGIAQALINAGADVNSSYCSISIPNETPLHVCAIYGNYDIALTLIEAGADVNSKNSHEETPLHYCFHYPRITELLINAQCNVNEEGELGEPPLFNAVRFKSPDAVKLLLDAGALPNNVNIYGKLPIYTITDTVSSKKFKWVFARDLCAVNETFIDYKIKPNAYSTIAKMLVTIESPLLIKQDQGEDGRNWTIFEQLNYKLNKRIADPDYKNLRSYIALFEEYDQQIAGYKDVLRICGKKLICFLYVLFKRIDAKRAIEYDKETQGLAPNPLRKFQIIPNTMINLIAQYILDGSYDFTSSLILNNDEEQRPHKRLKLAPQKNN